MTNGIQAIRRAADNATRRMSRAEEAMIDAYAACAADGISTEAARGDRRVQAAEAKYAAAYRAAAEADAAYAAAARTDGAAQIRAMADRVRAASDADILGARV